MSHLLEERNTMLLSLMISQDIIRCICGMLKVKHQACLGSFKNEYELDCETFIKRRRSDRGGEYYDPSFV